MYTLTRLLPIEELLLRQAPALLLSLLLAEAFYKFGSFSLECVAFLGTWFVLDLVGKLVSQLFGGERAAERE